MFGTIRKHQTWLWGVIITLTIASFVVFFSPYTRMNGNVRAGSHGSINGEKITDQMYVDAWREVHLYRLMTTGRWPEEDKQSSGFDPDREAYNWLLVVQKQKDLGIYVGDEAAEQFARQLLKRLGVESPQVFVDQVLVRRGYQPDDFERFVRHFLGIQEMITTMGLSGTLIPPDQAKALYQRDHQELATEAVVFPETNYEAAVEVKPETLSQFYSNQVVNYMIPERMQVSYVEFPASDYVTQAESQLTNLTQLVDLTYQRRGTNAAPEARNETEAKASIRQQIIHEQALMDAHKKALNFANNLFAIEPMQPQNLNRLAASNNLPVRVTQPFDEEAGPKELDGSAEFAKAAFKMTRDEPFAQPVVTTNGVYVMALDRVIPRETPPLDQIKARVTADYKRLQARRIAQQSAMAFTHAVTNGLSAGKTFAAIAAESNVKAVELPPFSISTRSLPEIDENVSLGELKQAAFSTAPGHPSQVIPTRQGAMVVFVKAKIPIDPAREKEELPSYITQLRHTRQQEAFDEWLRREAQVGLRDTPAGQPPRPPAMVNKTASAK